MASRFGDDSWHSQMWHVPDQLHGSLAVQTSGRISAVLHVNCCHTCCASAAPLHFSRASSPFLLGLASLFTSLALSHAKGGCRSTEQSQILKAYVGKALCNFPCLSCLNIVRTHSTNFFGIKPYDWEWAQQAVYAHRPRVVSKLVILLEYSWTEPSRTDVSLETHISPLLPFL